MLIVPGMNASPHPYRILLRSLLATSSLLFLPSLPTAHADTYIWQGIQAGSSGQPNYAEANNWSPSAVPDLNDVVYFTDAGTLTTGIFGGTTRRANTFYFEASKDYSFILSRDDRHYELTNGIRQNGSGAVLFTASIQFGSGATIAGTGSGDIVFERFLPGTRGLVIESEGTFKVYVNGTQTATAGANTLNTSASFLGGEGRLSRLLDIQAAGATVAAGAKGSAGTLTLAGGFSSLVQTRFEFDLGGTEGAHDQLAITGGTFHLGDPGDGGYQIFLRDLGLSDVTAGSPIILIRAESGVTLEMDALNPNAFSIAELPTGWQLDAAYGQGGLLFDPLSGQLSVQFEAIPEPTTALLLMTAGAAASLSWRRLRDGRRQ